MRRNQLMNLHLALSVLGLSEPLTLDKIKKAYRRKAIETHPDKGGDREEFIKINEAYKALTAYGMDVLKNGYPPQPQPVTTWVYVYSDTNSTTCCTF